MYQPKRVKGWMFISKAIETLQPMAFPSALRIGVDVACSKHDGPLSSRWVCSRLQTKGVIDFDIYVTNCGGVNIGLSPLPVIVEMKVYRDSLLKM